MKGGLCFIFALVALLQAAKTEEVASGVSTEDAALLKLFTVEQLQRELAARAAHTGGIQPVGRPGLGRSVSFFKGTVALTDGMEWNTASPFKIETAGTPNLALSHIKSHALIEAIYIDQRPPYGLTDPEKVKLSARDDRRREISELADGVVIAQARSVAALCDVQNIKDNGDGTSSLQGHTLREARMVCEEVPFSEEKVCAYGTAFLVAENLLVTAGHCLEGTGIPPSARIRVVFGFSVSSKGQDPTLVSNSDIYEIDRIVDQGGDWAIVKLKTAVTNRPPLGLRRSGEVPVGAKLYVIGYPLGLAEKFADQAVVRSLDADSFISNLDTFGGNSGSPVFNADTHSVEGILVRGQPDFFYNGEGMCHYPSIYPDTGPSGELSIKIGQLRDKLPEEFASSATHP